MWKRNDISTQIGLDVAVLDRIIGINFKYSSLRSFQPQALKPDSFSYKVASSQFAVIIKSM